MPVFSLTDRRELRLGSIDSPAAFLTAIGRSADTKLNVETWEQLWKMNSEAMRKAGLAVRDRRYAASRCARC